MSDILPDETPYWQFLENTVATVLASYGYSEIRLPVVEKTALFKRSIGEVTDIVEKEMYTFDDRNGDSMTLRPEGTAGVCERPFSRICSLPTGGCGTRGQCFDTSAHRKDDSGISSGWRGIFWSCHTGYGCRANSDVCQAVAAIGANGLCGIAA